MDNMCKGKVTLIMLVMAMISLCGCYKKDENRTFDEIKRETGSSNEKNEIITALNNKHNQYNAYCICEENEYAIQQLTLAGQTVNTFEVTKKEKGIALLEIAYVTDEEILYILDKDDKCELWSIPLVHHNNKEHVQTQKKKLLFRTTNLMNVLYADAEYIACKENLHYAEYDRIHQKKVLINEKKKKDSYSQPDSFIINNMELGNRNVDGMILLAKNVGENQYPKNIYVHKVGSGKVKKIANTYISKNWTIELVYSDNMIYYTGLKKDWRNEEQSWQIWCYDCKSNSNNCIIEENQLKDTVSFSKIDALFLNYNELWIEIENEKCGFLYYPFVSHKKQSESVIKKATKLNQYIYSLNNENKDISVLNIGDNQCIIEESNASDSKIHCYDIKNARECWLFDS